ncbi:MAG: hypothetical protein ABI663_05720 [Chryseolinea sp.]
MTREEALELSILLCGVGHIVLSLASTAIPTLLNWKKELNVLQPLIKQMFWTYAAYILVINFCFGLVSILGTAELLNKSFLAKSVTIFIGLYWFARVIIQFFYFDKTHAPKGLIFTLGEIGLVALFVVFTVVYLAAFLYNLSWI